MLVILSVIFILVQISLHGDFQTAFLVDYVSRTGAELSGNLRFVFYPVISGFVAAVLLFSVHLFARRDRVNLLNIVILAGTLLLFFAMGSRNLLLWSFSAAVTILLSKLRYNQIVFFTVGIYVFAVLFAYYRNNGLLSYLSGNIDQLYTPLLWAYFDPLIHEFGSSFRTFSLILGNPVAEQQLSNAPYGLLESFFMNQLPSFLKPSDFISFTDYTSLLFAARGEGIGSSPMIEAHLSGLSSLLALVLLLVFAYWPAYHLRHWPALRFFTYVLVVALSFNVWRIGSAEILKMFGSSVVAMFIIAKICDFRVLQFNEVR
jgi:uncharacterized membrane protein YqjE